LDFAIARDIPYGGWCPRGGWAEDQTTPPGLLAQYPDLKETPEADVAQRTTWNVRDSDATLILTQRSEETDSHGTDLTERSAAELARPFVVVDVLDPERAKIAIRQLVDALPAGATLNIAGPRESEAPGIYARSLELLDLCYPERTGHDG